MILMSTSGDARLPLYQRLKDVFVERISLGDWSRAAALPSENQLAETYGVAVGTVRKAIEALVADGVLERQQGRGTFVRRPDFGNALFRFFRLSDASGAVIKPTARILVRTVGPADRVVAEALKLAPRAPVLKLLRERCVGGQSILVEDIAVDVTRFKALVDRPIEAFGDLMYPLYEEVCGQLVTRATENISFGTATPRIAKALGRDTGAPIAVIERVARGFDGAPLEWRRSCGLADQFNYTIDLK